MFLQRVFARKAFPLLNHQAFSFAYSPSAKEVKALRTMTGSPLKDCLKALNETEGDLEASKDVLRKSGLAAAEKRSDRLATEGLIGLMVDEANRKATMIQLSCETDFVAKTDNFQKGLMSILNTLHNQDLTVNVKQS
jgi:elongation factor Ts